MTRGGARAGDRVRLHPDPERAGTDGLVLRVGPGHLSVRLDRGRVVRVQARDVARVYRAADGLTDEAREFGHMLSRGPWGDR